MIKHLKYIATFALVMALAAMVNSCGSDSGVDDQIQSEGENAQNDTSTSQDIYKSLFLKQTLAGIYYDGVAAKQYDKSSGDQISYRSDLGEYSISNYLSTAYYTLTLTGSMVVGSTLAVEVKTVGISSLSSSSYSMDFVQSSEDGSTHWLWSEEDSVGVIIVEL